MYRLSYSNIRKLISNMEAQKAKRMQHAKTLASTTQTPAKNSSSSEGTHVLYIQKNITRQNLQSNPSLLYLFGDNEARWGFGGQAAAMRGEPNALGICSKKSPSEFWSDDEYDVNTYIIDTDIDSVTMALISGKYHGLVMPADGIGTGLARLQEKAPKTFAYLQDSLEYIKGLAIKGHGNQCQSKTSRLECHGRVISGSEAQKEQTAQDATSTTSG